MRYVAMTTVLCVVLAGCATNNQNMAYNDGGMDQPIAGQSWSSGAHNRGFHRNGQHNKTGRNQTDRTAYMRTPDQTGGKTFFPFFNTGGGNRQPTAATTRTSTASPSGGGPVFSPPSSGGGGHVFTPTPVSSGHTFEAKIPDIPAAATTSDTSSSAPAAVSLPAAPVFSKTMR